MTFIILMLGFWISVSWQVHEYVKILDQSTGAIRVESGSQGSSKQVFLGPHDKVLDNGKKKAGKKRKNAAVTAKRVSKFEVTHQHVLHRTLFRLCNHTIKDFIQLR